MSSVDVVRKFVKQLYPTGRAFNYPRGGHLDKLHKGLAITQGKVIDDSLSILNQILPDNIFFTAEDASKWEKRLGMIDGSLNSLADRKSAIIRKMNHPGNIPARQSWDYLQSQLQLAGFDVYVHENIPLAVMSDGGTFQLGQHQLGQYGLGDYPFQNIIANNIDESIDSQYTVHPSGRQIFSIGGAVLHSDADVLETRKNEFRQLILKIKPVQTIGYLYINYI